MNRTGLFLFIAVVILAGAGYWYYTTKMKPAEGGDQMAPTATDSSTTPAPTDGSAPAPAPTDGTAPAPAPTDGSAPAPAPEPAPAPAPSGGSGGQ